MEVGTDSGYVSATSSVAGDAIAVARTSASHRGQDGKGKEEVKDKSWEELQADADAAAEEQKEEEKRDDEGAGSEAQGTRTVGEMEQGFFRIYEAIRKLKKEFDEKFRKMFA
ncbi:MAG: hypothetical protein Q9224_007665 [Gallowayella concinna]